MCRMTDVDKPPPSTAQIIQARIAAHRMSITRRTAVTASALAALGMVLADASGALHPGQSAEALEEPWGGHQNGNIPFSAMTSVPAFAGPYLRPDAASAYFRLNDAFRARFGRNLDIREAYRDIAQQQYRHDLAARGGNPAAPVGHSPHGWGTACDFGSRVNSYGTAEKIWADANGPSFGWIPTGNSFTPKSAREPWHFEYIPGGTYTPPADPLYNQKDGEMSYTVRNSTSGGIYTMAAQFIKHEPSTLSGQTAANVTTQDDSLISLDNGSFLMFLDSLGIPQDKIPTNGAIWSRELEILTKLDQILAKA